jgi:predicted dehydrogenase
MADDITRVGFIGAGANTGRRHIPGLRAMPGVELAGVANRSMASSQRAADEYEISKAYADWVDLIDDDDIDAVCIGTWPYMHRTLTLAALEAGKHVLCEARMAMNSDEAHEMLDASRANPDLITQVVPPPHMMTAEQHLIDLISDGYVGNVLHVNARVFNERGWPDTNTPVHWRHDRDLSGNNVMTMGIWYENLMRLVGHASSVQAQGQTIVKHRKNAEGRRVEMTIPDQLDILYTLAGGGTVNMSVATAIGTHQPPFDLWIFGDDGTIHIDTPDFTQPGSPTLRIMGGKRSDSAMSEIVVPENKVGGWRVEEEFINAIRGIEPVTRSNFTDSVKYMEFTDAVQMAWQSGERISLPL